MIYYDQNHPVLFPRENVSNVRILFDGGEEGITLAALEWNDNPCLGIRWNVSENEWDNVEKEAERIRCVGMPSRGSTPLWFILPRPELEGFNRIIQELQNLH